MALAPKISKSSVSADATTLYIADGTGAYSATNAGGYGGGGNPAYTDVYDSYIKIFLPESTTIDATIYLDGGSSPTAINFANPANTSLITINSTTFGSTGVLSDGVYQFDYYVGYDALTNFIFLNGSPDVLAAGIDLTSEIYAGVFVLGEDLVLYEVLTCVLNGGDTEITLVENYGGAGNPSTAGYYYYYGTSKIAFYQNSNNCYVNLAGQYALSVDANACDDCSTKKGNIAVAAGLDYLCLQAQEAKAAVDATYWTLLQNNITTYQTKYCGSGATCGCS